MMGYEISHEGVRIAGASDTRLCSELKGGAPATLASNECIALRGSCRGTDAAAPLFMISSEIFTIPTHVSALFSSFFSQKNSSPLLHWGRKRDTISYCMNLSRSVPSQAETDDPRGPESPVPYHYHNQERHTDAQH